MNSQKSNNAASEIKSKSFNKSGNKKIIEKLDNPMKIYDYENRVRMTQYKINQRVREERKNIEKNLTKLTTNFPSFTSRNFYRDYQKYKKKYFKTENLVEDIAEKYQEKGYNIHNMNHNFFKVNPLLDSNVNKLFISYLFERKKGEKINYDKLLRKNKALKYIKKLKNIISPEDEEKKYKSKKNKRKYKKYKIFSKDKIRRSESGLIHFRNARNYHINIESEPSNKKNYSSRNLKLIFKANNKITNSFSTNKKNKNQLNRSKSINYPESTLQTERKNNKHISYKVNLNKKNEQYFNIPKEKNKTRNSSNNLVFLNTISILNKFKTSQNINQIFLKTEKKLSEKINEDSSDTSKNKNKDRTNFSSHSKTSNTKAFSSNNTEINFSSNNKIPSSKANNILFSHKIKEFSVNSKKEKNSIDSKKIMINDYASKNISYPKLSRYSYSYKIKPFENTKIDNPTNDIEKSSSINQKKINLSDEKEKAINRIYKQLKAGKYENLENKIRNYLSKMKKMKENEIDYYINKYQYKNIKSNLNELNKYINQKKLRNKIERIYSNNDDYFRIEPLINSLKNKEKDILRFNNKISKIFNKS